MVCDFHDFTSSEEHLHLIFTVEEENKSIWQPTTKHLFNKNPVQSQAWSPRRSQLKHQWLSACTEIFADLSTLNWSEILNYHWSQRYNIRAPDTPGYVAFYPSFLAQWVRVHTSLSMALKLFLCCFSLSPLLFSLAQRKISGILGITQTNTNKLWCEPVPQHSWCDGAGVSSRLGLWQTGVIIPCKGWLPFQGMSQGRSQGHVTALPWAPSPYTEHCTDMDEVTTTLWSFFLSSPDLAELQKGKSFPKAWGQPCVCVWKGGEEGWGRQGAQGLWQLWLSVVNVKFLSLNHQALKICKPLLCS